MTTKSFAQHLDHVLLFILEVSLFHGNRKVNPADLDDALQVSVEQDDVFTLGVKRVFDKEYINELNRVKSGMERTCTNAGPKFLSGHAVPEAKADAVAAELEEWVKKGDAIKSRILVNFTKICDDYASRHPKWTDVIERHSFSESYVRNRIHFGWRAIKVSAGRDDGLISDGLSQEVGGLLGTLLSDVAKASNRFISESLTGRDDVTRKALRPLVNAREKLMGFTFLDSRIEPLCDIIQAVVATMPDEGRIEGVHLANLIGMASILSKTSLALEVGAKASERDTEAVFEEFFAVPKKEVILQVASALAVSPAIGQVLPQGFAMQSSVKTPKAPTAPISPFAFVQVGASASVDFNNLFG